MGSSGRRIVFLSGIVLALTGCTPGGSAQPPGGAAPVGSPAVAVRPASPPPAWPGARVTTVDPHLPGGMLFGDVAATPDGKVFGFTFTPAVEAVADGHVEPHGQVVLLNPSDRRLEPVGGFAGTNHQVLFADADERWVTWTEASQQPAFEDWILFAHDRLSGRTRRIASAPTVNGRVVSTPYVEPRTDHGLVVWSAGVTRAPLGQHIDCFLAPAAGDQQIEVLATDCFHPIISWPYVVYLQHVGPLPGGYGELTAIDLRTRQHHAVGGVRNSRYYALAGTAFVYTTEGSQTIHLTDILSQGDQMLMDVSGSQDGFIEFPGISDRLVTWEERGGAWAFDRTHRQLVQLQAGAGFSAVYLRGTTLIWADDTKPNSPDRNFRVLRVLDTNQLK